MHSKYDKKKAGTYNQVVISDNPELIKTLSRSSWGYQEGVREQRTLHIAISQDVQGMKF